MEDSIVTGDLCTNKSQNAHILCVFTSVFFSLRITMHGSKNEKFKKRGDV